MRASVNPNASVNTNSSLIRLQHTQQEAKRSRHSLSLRPTTGQRTPTLIVFDTGNCKRLASTRLPSKRGFQFYIVEEVVILFVKLEKVVKFLLKDRRRGKDPSEQKRWTVQPSVWGFGWLAFCPEACSVSSCQPPASSVHGGDPMTDPERALMSL